MADKQGKEVNKTYLSLDNAENRGFIHRDYIAHCLRWNHITKFIGKSQRYKTARILDVGCGKELPLAKMLYSSRMAPDFYGGVDVAALVLPETFRNSKWKPSFLLGKTDICDVLPEALPEEPNVIVCFEMLEHIEPQHCVRTLIKFSELLESEGTLFISTPCFNYHVGAAANHVNEMTYHALGAVMERIGFRVEGHWGTFASISDYKHKLTPAQLEVWTELREYYDTNYLSTIMAPLYPEFSRNCLWQLKYNPNSPRMFQDLRDCQQPWGSSEKWIELEPENVS